MATCEQTIERGIRIVLTTTTTLEFAYHLRKGKWKTEKTLINHKAPGSQLSDEQCEEMFMK